MPGGASKSGKEAPAVVAAAPGDDVITGWRFVATLKVTTPLSVLERHGEEVARTCGSHTSLPVYGNQAQGIWVARAKTFRELGLDIPEFRASTHAADIGPADADRYIPFLKDFRRILESSASADARLARLRELPAVSRDYREFWNRHLERDPDFPLRMFHVHSSLWKLDGVGRVTAAALRSTGFHTLEQIADASLQDLTAVPGVGMKLAQRIQTSAIALRASGESSSTQADAL